MKQVASGSLKVLRKRVAALVHELGVIGAARKLQVSRECVTRIVAGLPVRRGTRALVARRLYELASRPEGVQ